VEAANNGTFDGFPFKILQLGILASYVPAGAQLIFIPSKSNQIVG
jgi:hypothetical protein